MACIHALQDVVTPEGTILMPSFNHGAPFHKNGPGIYDPATTPTSNGAIPDTCWRLPDVYRSLNPTHPFAAWGKQAKRYTAFHHRTLTMGPESPLGLLRADGGYGLFVGVTYATNTFHHVVEMTTGAPCLGRRTEAYPVRVSDGRIVQGRTWGWRADHCPITDELQYAALMKGRGFEKNLTIGQSPCTLFQLNDCFELLCDMMTNGYQNLPPCRSCPIRPRQVAQTVESDWDEKNHCLRPDSAAWEYEHIVPCCGHLR